MVKDGKNADDIALLATIPSELFGVAIATRDGAVYTVIALGAVSEGALRVCASSASVMSWSAAS